MDPAGTMFAPEPDEWFVNHESLASPIDPLTAEPTTTTSSQQEWLAYDTTLRSPNPSIFLAAPNSPGMFDASTNTPEQAAVQPLASPQPPMATDAPYTIKTFHSEFVEHSPQQPEPQPMQLVQTVPQVQLAFPPMTPQQLLPLHLQPLQHQLSIEKIQQPGFPVNNLYTIIKKAPATPSETLQYAGQITGTTHVVPVATIYPTPVVAVAAAEPAHALAHTHVVPATVAYPTQSRIAKKACVNCRKLKSSCSDERPCQRCVRKGKECVDRSEDEIPKRRSAAAFAQQQTVGVLPGIGAVPAVMPHVSHKRHERDPPSVHQHTPGQVCGLNEVAVIPAISIHSTPAEIDEISHQLFSRSYLAILVESGLRDLVLRLHSQIDALPLDLPTLLEWQTQCAVMCAKFTELMTVPDFEAWITHGLTEAELNSPAWAASPLAPWTRTSTRPFYFATAPLDPLSRTRIAESGFIERPPAPQLPACGTVVAASSAPTVGDSDSHSSPGSSSNSSMSGCSSTNTQPLLCDTIESRIEWLPAANIAYQRWQRMLVQKILFERQLRLDRAGHGAKVPAVALVAPKVSSKVSEQTHEMRWMTQNLQEPSMDFTDFDINALPPLPPLDATFFTDGVDVEISEPTSNSAGVISSGSSVSGSSVSGESQPTVGANTPPARTGTISAGGGQTLQKDELVDLECAMHSLALSQALLADPVPEQENDVVERPCHATWCPLNTWYLDHADAADAVAQEQAKMSKTSGMASVLHDASSALPANAPACGCSLSTPLPARFFINSAFEKILGWRRCEVERAMIREGRMFNRHLSPPSSWPIEQRAQAEHWAEQLTAVGYMAIRAAHRAGGLPPPDLPRVDAPAHHLAPYEVLRAKNGTLVPGKWQRSMQMQISDGASVPSAVTVIWRLLPGSEPISNQ